MHALCGLPRSGTTLLANLLSQHPDVYVSGTSALSLCVEAVVGQLSTVPEVQSDLANVPGAYDRYVGAMRAFARAWYADHDESCIIDKGRGWIMWRSLLAQLDPDARLIVCVRDPRDVVASIERQDRRTAAFHSPLARTAYEAAEVLMAADGMVGGPMRFAEDLIRRNLPVEWVRYETFVRDPLAVAERLSAALDLEPFTFNPANVANQATDLDALYRNKFPHDGSGQIKPPTHHWSEMFDAELAGLIASRWPLYSQTFGYV